MSNMKLLLYSVFFWVIAAQTMKVSTEIKAWSCETWFVLSVDLSNFALVVS